MLETLCPEFLADAPDSLVRCTEPASLELFTCLLVEIGRELQELGAGASRPFSATVCEGGYEYQVEGMTHFADERGLIELLRFGVVLDVPDTSLAQKIQNRARTLLKKEVNGAWKVAQRRWKRFASSGKLHAAGQALHTQARRVESALSLVLSDPELVCTRADLATDWLAGVDLWLHRPNTAPAKGQALALSLLKARGVEQKKADAAGGVCTLWTPQRLAEGLVSELGASSAGAAQELWAALGQSVDLQILAQHLRASLFTLATAGRHPSTQAPELVPWLRAQRLKAQ